MLHHSLNTRFARRWMAGFLTLGALLAVCLAPRQDARAEAPAPPQLYLAERQLALYQNGNMGPGSPTVSAFITEQDADGTFRDGNGKLSGRISAVRNGLGEVIGHRISFTRRVSPAVTEVFSGSIQAVPNGGSLYLAGSYERRARVNPQFKLLKTTGPFPFHGQAFYIGG